MFRVLPYLLLVPAVGWVGNIGAPFAASDINEQGRVLFTSAAQPPCAICHTLRDAKATGEIGPSLNEIKPDEDRVRQALQTGIGQMPAFDSLSDEQKNILAKYVARVSRE
jgi:mono/diheme cytochrome c family protein